MALAAPWTRTPDWWSPEHAPASGADPATTSLVSAMCSPEDHGPGLWTALECTHPDDRVKIAEAILVDALPIEVLDDIADVLVEKLTGWKRWEATQVWTKTLGGWPVIDGDLTMRGVDLAALPVSRSTNVAYSWWRTNLGRDEQAWKKFVRDMEREPLRVLERKANEGMPVDAFARLASLTARKPKAPGAVPESTITMPGHDTLS